MRRRECHELNFPSPPVLVYFSHHIVAEAVLSETIGDIIVYHFSILDLASLLVCARDSSCSRRAINAKIGSQGAHYKGFCVAEPRSRSCCARSLHRINFCRVVRFSTRASHPKRSQKVTWLESSCRRSFPSTFAEWAYEWVEAFTVLCQKRGTIGELLPFENLSEILATWYSNKIFRFCDTAWALACYRRELTSLEASDSGVPVTPPRYYVDVARKGDWIFQN